MQLEKCPGSVDSCTGGLLRAIRLINEAKAKAAKTTNTNTNLTVDLHPDRPEYRGFCFGCKIISLEADPSFEEIERAGAVVDRHADAHTVLDDMFLISGMIPRVTPYETGLKGAVRYDSSTNDWLSDELIRDERLLMCNLKGAYRRYIATNIMHSDHHHLYYVQGKESSFSQAAAMQALSMLASMLSTCCMVPYLCMLSSVGTI